MEIRKTIIPKSKKGLPLSGEREREYIYFTVKFNSFRDVSHSTANEVIDKEELKECECVLLLPEGYSDSGAPTQLIISCHGAGGKVDSERDSIGGVAYVTDLVDHGYAALDVNGSKPDGLTMGCPEHIFALYKAYKYAISHYNLTEKVLVAGASMGGTTALNFAHTFPSIVLSLGLFFPRINIEGVTVGDHYCIGTFDKDERKNGNPSTKDRVIQVFRMPSEEWCEENVIGFDPFRTRSFIGMDGKRVVIPPCPIKIWQGTADKVVDPVMIKEFVDSIHRSSSYAELHLMEGVAHDINGVMKTELEMWFNRFI